MPKQMLSPLAQVIEDDWSRKEFQAGVKSGAPSILKTVLLARVVSSVVTTARRRR